MKEVPSIPKRHKLETQIAHVVLREPDVITVGDSCLEVAGAKSDKLKLWWHVEYPENFNNVTLKRLKITRRYKLSNKSISINLLEFVVEIICYVAVTVLFRNNHKLCSQPYPLLLNLIDKETSEAWIRKVVTKTIKCSSLQRIICILMINNPVGLKAECIEGVRHVHADDISRIYSKPNKPLTFYQSFQDFPQMKSWTRFHPSQELRSAIYSALLEGREPGLCLTKTLGHFIHNKTVL